MERRHFLSTTAAMAFAAENAKDVRRALAEHKRAVWVKDGWVRDPYIVLAPDGFYYYTGTTQPPGQPEEVYNTGLGPKSKVGWHMQAWRGRDLAQWVSHGTPFTLEQGVWAKEEKSTSSTTVPDTCTDSQAAHKTVNMPSSSS
jgi:arylsulfatase